MRAGKTYKEDCIVPREDLRYLLILHKDKDGNTHQGEMVVHKLIAEDVLEIFEKLYDAGYPIERMVLPDNYMADDETMMREYINENCNQKQSSDCECNRIIYDLNGGTLEGDRGPVIVEAESGKEYTLLNAPVKKGARFVRWASSCKDIHVSLPGESFRFTHCVKFVAVWDESEIKSSGKSHGGDRDYDDDSERDDDRDDSDDEEAEDEGPDVTETVNVTTGNEEELNLNSIKVDSNSAVGVRVSASCDVDVDDEISVIGGDQGATGIIASAEGKEIETEIETGDGMTVKSEGGSVGIEAYASGDGAVSLEFEGDITVSNGS